MKGKELRNLGLSKLQTAAAQRACRAAAEAGASKRAIREAVRAVIADPKAHLHRAHFAELAEALSAPDAWREPSEPAPWAQWGADLDENSIEQMRQACRLPVARRGALMPDAHLGYGLPIGGVLATEGAVIPYAVGVDIACRMRLSVLDIDPSALDDQKERAHLRDALVSETRFGIGAAFKRPRDHEVLDRDWQRDPLTRRLKEKATAQLGTSGSGNHFAEYGLFTLDEPDLGLSPGTYLALMTHSGSRGAGATVAGHYSKLARELHPELPRELKNLAWLDLDTPEGQAYWEAMELMGAYAAANHEVIHREVVRALGARALTHVENHHNFAWKEEHDGKEVIVHRKGATPAGRGVLGVIPGSMATPAYIVRGRGNEESLRSASHGAGRVMSRKQAKRTLRWDDAKRELDAKGVELLSAGLDEVPAVYKEIGAVMAAQTDLVDIVARFHPKMVKMAPPGERAED